MITIKTYVAYFEKNIQTGDPKKDIILISYALPDSEEVDPVFLLKYFAGKIDEVQKDTECGYNLKQIQINITSGV